MRGSPRARNAADGGHKPATMQSERKERNTKIKEYEDTKKRLYLPTWYLFICWLSRC